VLNENGIFVLEERLAQCFAENSLKIANANAVSRKTNARCPENI